MLVLTRIAGESIMVGDGIEIVVLSVDRNQVRIGITAPAEVKLHRREVWERIKAKRLEQPQRRPRLLGEVDEIGNP